MKDFHLICSCCGTVVMGVKNSPKAASLYFSDEEGFWFSESLSDIRFFIGNNNSLFAVDVYKVNEKLLR